MAFKINSQLSIHMYPNWRNGYGARLDHDPAHIHIKHGKKKEEEYRFNIVEMTFMFEEGNTYLPPKKEQEFIRNWVLQNRDYLLQLWESGVGSP